MFLHLGGEPTYLNPILSTDSPSSAVEGLIFSGLFRTNSNLELEPDLVESYSVNANGTHYTFKLKENIRWHDGAPFTAHDVKFTFDKILDKSTNTVRRSNFILDNEPIQFNVINDFTIDAVLPKPFAPFLIRMALGILPKHLLDNQDINKSPFNRAPIGTGPYKFKTWESAQFIHLEKNNIQSRPFYPDLNFAKYFKDSSRYPESEPFGNSGMYLPCGPSQSGDNINRVIETLHKFTIS